MMSEKEIMLRANENGEWDVYEPYATIVVETEEDFKNIQEALEKQIFKFVECKGWKGHSGTRYKCPTCKKIIRCGYEYCSNCGQAVKFPKTKLVDGRIVLDWCEANEDEVKL